MQGRDKFMDRGSISKAEAEKLDRLCGSDENEPMSKSNRRLMEISEELEHHRNETARLLSEAHHIAEQGEIAVHQAKKLIEAFGKQEPSRY